MKTISKRLISLALVLALLVSAVPFAVSAAEAEDIADTGAEADVVDTAAEADDVVDTAAEADEVADTGADADVAVTGDSVNPGFGPILYHTPIYNTTNSTPVKDFVSPYGINVTTAGTPYDTAEAYCWGFKSNTSGYTEILEAGNKGKHKTEAYLRIEAIVDGKLSFDYFSSSTIASGDYLAWSLGNSDTIDLDSENTYKNVYSAKKDAGFDPKTGITITTSKTFATETIDMTAGQILMITYHKNASTNGGSDCAWIKNIGYTPTVAKADQTANSTITFQTVHGSGTVSKTNGGTALTSSTDTVGVNQKFFFSYNTSTYKAVRLYSDPECTKPVELTMYYTSNKPENFCYIPYKQTNTTFYLKFMKQSDVISGDTVFPAVDDLTITTDYHDYVNCTSSYTKRAAPSGFRSTMYEGAVTLSSYGYHARKSSFYDYLKFTAGKSGILKFKYHVDANSTSYFKLAYGPTKLTSSSSLPTGDTWLVNSSLPSAAWTSCEIEIVEGETVYVSSYKAANDTNLAKSQTVWLKDIEFDTNVSTSTIKFDCGSGADKHGKVVSGTDSASGTAVTESTGFTGRAAGTFYVIPDRGYEIAGIYTNPDFSGTKVNPKSNSAYRTFNFNYPAEADGEITYYVKFVPQATVTYTFDYDTDIFDTFGATVVNTYNLSPGQSLSVSDTVHTVNSGSTFTVYNGDKINVTFAFKSDYEFSNITHNGTALSGVSSTFASSTLKTTVTFVAKQAQDGWTLTFNATDFNNYTLIDEYESDLPIEVYTRPECTFQKRDYYPWTYDSGTEVFTSGNTGIDSSYSYLKIKAETNGVLRLQYKVSGEEGWFGPSDYIMFYKGKQDINSYPDDDSCSSDADWTPIEFSVEAGDEVRIAYYKDSSDSEGDDCAWIKIDGFTHGPKTVTVESSDTSLGTASIVGSAGSSTQATMLSEVPVKAEATSAGQFVEWKDSNGNIVSYDAEYNHTVLDNVGLTAVFAPALVSGVDAVAAIGSAQFASINDAVAFAARGDVVVVLEGEHELNQDVTIPDGVTLLVPFDDDHTLSTDESNMPRIITCSSTHTAREDYLVSKQAVTLTENHYAKLTVKSGHSITVADGGAICVNSMIPTTNPNAPVDSNGIVYGKYGHIVLESDSSINLNGSSKLYCYGFITGAGKVNVNDTARVYEHFVIQDWPGGTYAAMFAENNQFPFNQYYVQNVECAMTFCSGAKEYAFCAVNVPTALTNESMFIEFIGQNGMFILNSGSTLTKYYDPDEDKCKYTLDGDCAIGDISLEVGVNVSSRLFFLPINNIDFEIKSGTLSVDSKVLFLPGSTVTVDEGATIDLLTGGQVVFADKDLTGYSYLGHTAYNSRVPVRFTPSRTPMAKTYSAAEWSSVEPATLDNNGTVIVEEGACMCSTSGGALITSSTGEGVYRIKSYAAAEPLIYNNGKNSGEFFETFYAGAQAPDSTGSIVPLTDKWAEGIDSYYVYDPVTKTWDDIRTVYYYAHTAGSFDVEASNTYFATNSNVRLSTRVAQGADLPSIYPGMIWSFITQDNNGNNDYQHNFTGWVYEVYQGNEPPTSSKLKIALTGASRDLASTGSAPALVARAQYGESVPVPYDYSWKGKNNSGSDVTVVTQASYGTYPVVTPDSAAWPTGIAQSYVDTDDGKTYYIAGWQDDDTSAIDAIGNSLAKVTGDKSYTAVYRSAFDNISLTLDDGIKVNYFVNVPAPYTVDDVRVEFSWGKQFVSSVDGRDYTYSSEPMTASVDIAYNTGLGRYFAAVNIAPKEINDTITANLVLKSDGTVIDSDDSFSAATYLYNVISYDTEAIARNVFNVAPGTTVTPKQSVAAEDLQSLCKTTLSYAAASQLVFEYNETNLADALLSAADKMDNSDAVDQAKIDIENEYYRCCDPDNLNSLESKIWDVDFTSVGFNSYKSINSQWSGGYYGSAMTLDYNATYNLYFHYKDYVKYSANIISVDRDTLNTLPLSERFDSNRIGIKVLNNGDFVRLDILHIPSDHLNDTFKVTLTPENGGDAVTFYASPMTYYCNVLHDGEDNASPELKNVVANVYLYSTAAAIYFESRDSALS